MSYIRPTTEAWSRLLLFESRDHASRLYREKHGREMSAQKAHEVNSAFAQGREYFAAADAAGELVSPLLQYYGVVALARGTILFARTEARERSLAQSHGIKVLGWEGLDGGDASRLDTLRLRVTNGTFRDLAVTTNNRCLEWVDADMHGTWFIGAVHADVARRPPPTDSEMTVRDLLRRIPALADLCDEIFEERSACHNATVRMNAEGTRAKVEVAHFQYDRTKLQTLVSALGFDDNIVWKQVADPARFGNEPHWALAGC